MTKGKPASKIKLPFSFAHRIAYFAMVLLMFCAGAGALVIQHKHSKLQHATSSPTNTGNNCPLTSSGCPNNQSSRTSTPTIQTPPQKQSVPQSNTTSQNQSDCSRKVIPYKTTYQNVSYLQKGQTQEAGGVDGSSLDCGDGKPIILNPVDKTVYVGAGLTNEEIQQQKAAAQQEYDQQYMQWLLIRDNAYQSCLNSLPGSYPSRENFCTSQAAKQAGTSPKQP